MRLSAHERHGTVPAQHWSEGAIQTMRKRIFILTLIMVIMTACFAWAETEGEGEDHGADAHSQSMSTESGDEPIEDITKTQDPGAEGVEPEDTEEAAPEAEPEPTPAPAQTEDQDDPSDKASEDEGSGILQSLQELIAGIPRIYIAGAAGALVLLIIILAAAKAAKRRRIRKEKAYRGKHSKD